MDKDGATSVPFGSPEWFTFMEKSKISCERMRTAHNERPDTLWSPGLEYDENDWENWPYAGTQADLKDRTRPPAYTKLSDYWVARLIASDPLTSFGERHRLWR